MICLSLVALLLAADLSAAEGSVEAGKQKAATCAACHGIDGNSLNPEWPNLAGQNENYLFEALQSFRPGGTRENVLMVGQVATLDDQDMADLAAYFAAQTRKPLAADPDKLSVGERLFRGGNKDRGVSACIACHGPQGLGNPPAAYPALAGQHAAYVAAQLRAYASQQRKSDPAQMMRNISALLSEEEILAVSAYVQGLY